MNDETLFHQAQGMPPAERAAFLAQTCGDDAALRRRIESLLEAHDNPGSFMSEPLVEAPATLEMEARDPVRGTQPRVPDAEVGRMIDRYKILQQIGEGGFGTVYMAEQEKPVRRRVAVKIVKVGMDTKAVIARFEAERQALAMMDHPNIARVLDAGTTVSGQPYFAMELVKGIPITEYCDQANLNMRQRLELFMDVCRAVQHAHQKGVIHRDLKPSNVMVTLHDAKPVVKVIDFGIAKATDQKLTEKTLFTNYGQMIGTPAYMSPEQAVMSGLDVDTRSDVYSLGVLLYELLTGSPPFDAKTLRSAGFDEMRRIIREDQPQKPSTRLSTLAADLKLAVAAQRQVSPQVLSRQLHGDLDWMILKAIEKDRVRRYESASAFAQDIERHLRSEPVSAGAPGAGYRARKFLQRNKGPMAAAFALVALLLAGTAVSTWQAVIATRAKRQAFAAVSEKDIALAAEAAQRRQAEISRKNALDAAAQAQAANAQAQKRLVQVEKANQILGSIFENLDPSEIAKAHRPLQAILVEKLDKAVQQLEGESVGDALAVATMQDILGSSLWSLGEPNKAIVVLAKSRATRQALLGPVDDATLISMNDLALAYLDAGKLDLAVPLFEDTLKARKANFGASHPDTLKGMSNLAVAYQAAGKLDLALPLTEQSLKLLTARVGPNHRDTMTAMNNLAAMYDAAGQMDLSLPLFEQTLTARKANLGLEHPETLVSMNNLAMAYKHAGEVDKSVSLLEQTLKLRKARLGPEHPDTFMTMSALAEAYQALGKQDLALPLFEEALEFRKLKLGREYPDTLNSMALLGGALLQAKDFARAEQILRECVAGRVKKFPDDWETFYTINLLGGALLGQKKYAEAEPLLREGYEGMKHREPEIPFQAKARMIGALGTLVGSYFKLSRELIAADKIESAEDARRKGMAILEDLQSQIARNDGLAASGYSELIQTLMDDGQRELAWALARKLLALHGNNSHAYDSVAWFLASTSNPANRDAVLSVKLAERAVVAAPNDRDVWNTLGVAEYRAGDWQAAIKALNRSMELRAGGSGYDWFFLAMANYQLNNRAEAHKWYDRAVQWTNQKPRSSELHRFQVEAEALIGMPVAPERALPLPATIPATNPIGP